MKIVRTYSLTAVFILYAISGLAQNIASTNQAIHLPEMISTRTVSQEVRNEANKLTTAQAQAQYLSSVVSSNTADLSAEENFRKSSALRLLGVLGKGNISVVDVLVSNLTFIDMKYRDEPAVFALIETGEKCAPILMDLIIHTSDEKKIPPALTALRWIKGPKNFKEFLPQQKEKMSLERWKLVVHSAIQ